jgi:probable phosphoglycerate mutase
MVQKYKNSLENANISVILQQKLMFMTTLYLVRHGETVDNVCQIMQGQSQGQLTENGIRQAETVRDKLRDVSFAAIIASDLKRSVDTARIIAEPHGQEVIQTPLLRERDWGGFTGRFIPELKGEVWPDDIETLENLLSRAGEFIAYVRETFPGKKVLAVGHGIINKAVQAVYYGKTMSEVQRMMNAEIRILEL